MQNRQNIKYLNGSAVLVDHRLVASQVIVFSRFFVGGYALPVWGGNYLGVWNRVLVFSDLGPCQAEVGFIQIGVLCITNQSRTLLVPRKILFWNVQRDQGRGF